MGTEPTSIKPATFAVFQYIDENPLRANQVEDRRAWRFGGLWHSRTGCRDLVDEGPQWLGLLFPERGLLALPGIG